MCSYFQKISPAAQFRNLIFKHFQKLVKLMAMLLTKLLKISGAESLSVAGNIFLGQTEAPLLIKAYLEKMTKSEILLVMIGGMATVAGAVLAAYIGFLGGEDEALKLFYAKHLLAASVMAAPGAIVISKILYPQTEKINTEVEVSKEKIEKVIGEIEDPAGHKYKVHHGPLLANAPLLDEEQQAIALLGDTPVAFPNMKNPITDKAASASRGEKLFVNNCVK